MRAVIMAGGRGTRVASVSREIPKPLLPWTGNRYWNIKSAP